MKSDPEQRQVSLLVVEDDEDDYLITSELLDESTTYRFEKQWVENAGEALDTLTAERFDLCLMDYQLGEHSGVDIVEKALGAGCTTPIIMLTGQDNTGIEIAAADAGAVDFLTKDGLTREQLSRAIRYALVRSDMQHEREERLNAEAANRYKSEFLANLSHEIRTPLTAIVGFTDLLLRTPPSDAIDSQEKLLSIRRNSKHLLSLLNDTLDLSKIEAGALELDNDQVDLDGFIAEVVSINSSAAEQKGLTCRVENRGKVPAIIHTDETRLRQILLNLLSNAVKFTQQGEIGLTVYLDDAGVEPLLCFDVTDTGVGVNAEDIRDIFEPYRQVNNLTSTGTGLGLTISRRLAELLGGSLAATSVPGKGSTFTCTVNPGPIDTDRLIDLDLNGKTADVAGALDSSQQGRVLVVDDVPDNRRLLADLAGAAGYRVSTAADGAEAVKLFKANMAAIDGQADSFNIVLLDLNMPVMDGYRTLAALKNLDPQLPVFAMTAGCVQGEREKCMAAGFDSYFAKPFRFEQLLEEMKEQLDKARGTPDQVSPAGNSGKTVLVVEDNADANQALCELLELSGHRALSALNGNTALDMAHDHQIDIVICDIHLDDWHGIELADKLGSLLPRAGIFIMSGDSQSESGDLPDRVSGFIHKPVGVDRLVEMGLMPETPD